MKLHQQSLAIAAPPAGPFGEYGGQVIQTSLSNDQEAALQEALDTRGAAA